MIVVGGSSPSVITMRLNSKEESYRYKIEVVGSNPTVATKLVRSSTGESIRLLPAAADMCSILTAPTMEI